MARSRWSRMTRLGALTSRVTSKLVTGRVQGIFQSDEQKEKTRHARQLEAVTDIASTLSQLKGAAMKVGQQLANVTAHLDLPPELEKQLSKLHNKAEPVPFSKIKATIEESLDGPLEELFATFDPAPLGTASLGQAHAATLPTGEDVVVKVLHDEAIENLETDLVALRGLLQSGRLFGRGKEELQTIYDEAQARLREEVDYLHEAGNIEAYFAAFGDDERIRIPRQYPSHSSERVLTMTRLYGDDIDTFMKTASPEAIARAGRSLGQLFLESTFRHKILHADPHPGNYLFEPDGRIGLLDYGCVKHFDEYFLARYAKVLLSAINDDREGTLQACRDLGVWAGEREDEADIIWEFCTTICQPFLNGERTLGAHDDELIESGKRLSMRLMQYPGITGVADMVFLHRGLGGLYSLGTKLHATARWDELLREHLSFAINRVQLG